MTVRSLTTASALLLGLLPLAGCPSGDKPDDTADTSDTSDSGDTTQLTDDFCGVVNLFNQYCVSCHSSTNTQGSLDLATDPYNAIVGQPSTQFDGTTLVVVGDAAGSLLYQKMIAAQGANGDEMPTTGILDASISDVVKTWIDGGASPECDNPDTNIDPETYHPAGYDQPDAHGMDAKYQRDTCLDCHGSDGGGGDVGVSCDDCHDAGWRTDCTYCHGGTDNNTGAPPVDIDNLTTDLSFPEHTVHVEETIHAPFDCTQCHTKPDNAFDGGHFLVSDSTAGVAEMMFSAGLSSRGSYSAGTCSNLYCHGNGQGDNGTAVSGNSYDCESCHSERRLSGEHGEHLGEDVECAECHSDTVDTRENIIGPSYHVNGQPDVNLPDGMTYSSGSCNGSCHGERHSNREW